jgi:RNA polymerase sigma-70 factor (ECF subfamily)
LYNDSNLLQRIALGDEQAFHTLFLQHRDKLFVFVRNLTKSENIAEDIIQEVFLKLWTQRESLAEVENANAYVFILVRNKIFDYLRKISNDKRLQEKVWKNIVSFNVSADEITGNIEEKDTQHIIEKAIKTLSPQQQKIFLLSRANGMSHEQIAEQLGISKNTVKNHLTTSLLIIRKYLKKYSHNLCIILFT